MKVILGADHAGLELKEHLVAHLTALGHEVTDLHDEALEVDYPDMAAALCSRITDGSHPLGILVCGTGVGISIAANKIPGIRAACISDVYSARMCRSHNDANVLCLGGRTLGPEKAYELAELFLSEPFAGERHARRVEKIAGLERRD